MDPEDVLTTLLLDPTATVAESERLAAALSDVWSDPDTEPDL